MVKIFLAGIESSPEIWDHFPYMLCSFMYAKKLGPEFWALAENFDEMMTDSGAHTYHAQTGTAGVRRQGAKKLPEPADYVHDYCKWIAEHRGAIDTPVELDIDAVVGWEKQLELRRIFETYNICPLYVWHATQPKSWEDYCRKYDYISMNRGENTFKKVQRHLEIADRYGCHVHVFAYTRLKEIKANQYFKSFYSVDSSTWLDGPKYGIAFDFNKGDMQYVYSDAWSKRFATPDKPTFNDLTDQEKNVFNAEQWKKYARHLQGLCDSSDRQVKLC